MAASSSAPVPASLASPASARGWEWLVAFVLLALGAAGVWKLPRAGVAAWERHALDVIHAVRAQRLGLMREAAESGPLLAWLRSEGAPAPATLPGGLAQQKSVGARHWERKGRRYSLLALELDGASTATLVGTIREGAPGDAEPPRVSAIGSWTLARWADPDVECLLLTDAPQPELTELLASQRPAQ